MYVFFVSLSVCSLCLVCQEAGNVVIPSTAHQGTHFNEPTLR